MAWIKFEICTSDKPEVWQIAQRLNIDPDAVVGKLLRVWAWFDEQTQDGNAPSVTKALLDRKLSVTGFCDAMIEAGWMIELENQISLPNFDRHNGSTAKKRALTSKRVAEHKASNGKVTQQVTHEKRKGNAPSVSAALPREEKRREDKNNTPPKPPVGEMGVLYEFGESLNTDAFRAAWKDWLRHRVEIKKPLKPTSATRQLAQLAKLGPEVATEWINYTIAKGWQGLQAPDADWKRANRVHEPDPWELPTND